MSVVTFEYMSNFFFVLAQRVLGGGGDLARHIRTCDRGIIGHTMNVTMVTGMHLNYDQAV